MKIGLFNDCFPPVMDGVSLTVKNYAEKLSHKGNEVTVVTPDEPGLKTEGKDYNIFSYMSLPVPRRHPYRWGLPQFDFTFQYRMNRTPFDIVHAHCPFSSGQVALKQARRQQIPIIATFHSKYREDFRRVIPNDYIVERLVRQVVEFYDACDEVWVPQASVGETLREYGYRGPMEVVDNGSEYAELVYSEKMKDEGRRLLYIKNGEPLLLFVGQHIWEKNVGVIIDALSRMTDIPWHMLFVGDGYARQDMIKKATELGLAGHDNYQQDRITFMGCVHDRKMLSQIYAAADLFLFPSIYDNAPLVVREAAALHTPTLVARGSNTAEVITDGTNGFLADAEAEAYANRLRYLLSRPCLIDFSAGNAARTLVRSWTNIAEEVQDRYQHLIRRMQRKQVAL
ncbi:MAG: glycosyltransferase [Prevotellaceae bacterium]|nr:glycosyltransferase [Prevotellaceae bacterium]